ncbi:GtrA family protein [Aquipuribacter nitratireducens]|uniref:GtrA family protein n=1 Tax=Aquipuribacter nitratireducens TaxID=650104 RepID=A0ABW0GNE3_9MICO
MSPTAPDTTVVVPTFNEGGNVEILVRRLSTALERPETAEVLFVDDSTDDTPDRVREVARQGHPVRVRLLHRAPGERVGGLAGAVTAGIRDSRASFVVVMDGDLQHPPELVPALRHAAEDADVVVASRYTGDGDAGGLAGSWRRSVSGVSTMLARACFPKRIGRLCTDPMTGFFCLRRAAVDTDRLRPRGFKILLEVLARHDLRVLELPFAFGVRHDGESKASWRNGLHFLHQLVSLRMGRMSRFAVVGALGALVNLAVMWALVAVATPYVAAAVVAAEVSILHNFLLSERFVFHDLRDGVHPWWSRALQFFAFNNIETALRLPALVALVSLTGLHPVAAQAVTIAVAFVVRFLFVSRVVYRGRPPRTVPVAPDAVVVASEGQPVGARRGA